MPGYLARYSRHTVENTGQAFRWISAFSGMHLKRHFAAGAVHQASPGEAVNFQQIINILYINIYFISKFYINI
jgi:hypothetical protein